MFGLHVCIDILVLKHKICNWGTYE